MIPTMNHYYSQLGPLNPGAVDTSSFAYITPDDLMLYCQSRLQGIDTQVQSAFARQQMDNADASRLNALAGSSTLSAPSAELDLNNSTDFQKAWDAYQQMCGTANACQDPATKQALLDQANQLGQRLQTAYDNMVGDSTQTTLPFNNDTDIDNFFNHGGMQDGNGNVISINGHDVKKNNDSGTKLETSDWSTLVTGAVKGVQDDINNNSELSMISLQALMSQRQEAIQVCTNLVQSLGDQVSKIADNVGK